MVRNLGIWLGLSFWPLSLFLANTPGDFLKYIIPVLLIAASFVLFRQNRKFYLAPLLLLPLFEPKLAPLPFIACFIDIVFSSRGRRASGPGGGRPARRSLGEGGERLKVGILLISLVLFAISFTGYKGQTIFVVNNDARQMVIGKTYLYPNPFLARIFQNKARIFIDRFNSNFFALVDPNNYFFGFHPREITVDNQNLKKFPFLGAIFVILGLFHLSKLKDKRFVVVLGATSLLSLSLLTNFDRTDIILWIPLSILFVFGFNTICELKKLRKPALALYFFFAIQEFLRIIIFR
ncbi:MAG: hypothetical protein Q7S60_04380 [bacterium]|nr:hypothetical protein [bacterium]